MAGERYATRHPAETAISRQAPSVARPTNLPVPAERNGPGKVAPAGNKTRRCAV